MSARKKGPGRHSDVTGLYLVVDPSGARRRVLRLMVQGRPRDIGLGGASIVSLAEAREAAQELRKIGRVGGDPRAVRDREKRASPALVRVAREVHAR
ncbi:Arm DNA-binding domain-containing protein [Albimonas pacifica]|uniref:Arm DNA-binding domain-containing protein n=1 Tax=Albimonas pacifica TaxID=1114924 RepID=UPI000B89AB7B